MENIVLASEIGLIKGVGAKTELLLKKLHIQTVKDLVYFFPKSYDEFEEPVAALDQLFSTLVSETCVSDTGALMPEYQPACAINVTICAKPALFRNKSLDIVNAKALGPQGEQIIIRWFHMSYLRQALDSGQHIILRGKVTKSKTGYHMEQPAIYQPDQYSKLQQTLQPVYPQIAKVSSKTIRRFIEAAFSQNLLSGIEDPLPKEIREKYDLLDLGTALKIMHFPEAKDMLTIARKRIVFDEFYLFMEQMELYKEELKETKNYYAISQDIRLESVIDRLPYHLTDAQLRVLKEVLHDLCEHKVMNRLVQGDVGSGKTILAFLSMYLVALNGYQSAMMVPTEVLAQQHYDKLCAMNELYKLNIRIALLTGSMTAKEKKQVYEKIAEGSIDIVIGTHALFQEKVSFSQLAYVITDEQHRFGVEQRKRLAAKGMTPHVLVMSATPIPRSLALILYADMDISIIDQLPANRKSIKNCVITPAKRKQTYQFIRNEINAGHQAYVICPMVDESEAFATCANVTDYTENLKKIYEKDNFGIAMLHGRLKNDQKNKIMKDFADHKIDILVSTTVIEVGIDVPNATTILIENAERFGLAQLHQLRGRVGRGDAQSYCIMIDGSGNKKTSKRLEIMNQSNDGFYIANEDLKLRGPGDFFGIRQSGAIGFSVADIYTDAYILNMAAQARNDMNFVL